MFAESDIRRPWTRIGISLAILSAGFTVLFSILDGVVRGPMLQQGAGSGTVAMLSSWCFNFRYFFEQLIYVGTLIFVAAKFFEGRTILTIGFDRLDAKRVSIKGPDEDNIVWIGHRYATNVEADAIAEAFRTRLKESSAA